MIYAYPLSKKVKLFTSWDEENYFTGDIGDYLAIRKDDPTDKYVIKSHLFSTLYSKC